MASTVSSASTEPWFCEVCRAGLLSPPPCELCPLVGGKNSIPICTKFNFSIVYLTQAYKFDILKKTHNSRKKLNNSAEKLKDLTKFAERRKKLKYFCCKNTFYQKSVAFSYNKNYAVFNKLNFFAKKFN